MRFRIHVGRRPLWILWPRSGSSVPRGSPSDRALPAGNSGGGRVRPALDAVEKGAARDVVEMGAARDIVLISSDGEDTGPAARRMPCDGADAEGATMGRDLVVVKKGKSDGVGVAKDDDDCVVLDSDPDGVITFVDGKGAAGNDGGSDELQIVAEKGQVACRDFPHSRHLCSNLPFGTTCHEKHCTMCYCYVCDSPAPCRLWGKGLSIDDHCHATDKETKWRTLRLNFKCKGLPAFHPEKENAVYPTMPSRDRLSLGNRSPLQNVVNQNQQLHTSERASLNVEPIVSAPRAYPVARAERSTSSARTSQVTLQVETAVSAPRPRPAARTGRVTSNTHTAQVVSAARAHPVARTGRVASNAQTAQVPDPVEPTVSTARAYPVARTGRGTNNAHTAQITHPVEPAVSAPRAYPVARAERYTANAHTATRAPPTTTCRSRTSMKGTGRTYQRNMRQRGPRCMSGTYHATLTTIPSRWASSMPESWCSRRYVQVIYDRETGQSCGFGYVTMSTVQEAEKAVWMYHGFEMYGGVGPLTVYITAPTVHATDPRRVARVDTAPRRVSVQNLRVQSAVESGRFLVGRAIQ